MNHLVLAVAAWAVALPLLFAPSAVPDAVIWNQLTALMGWGAWLLLTARLGAAPSAPGRRARASLWMVSAALGLCALAAAWCGGAQHAAALVLLAALALCWSAARQGLAPLVDAPAVLPIAWAWCGAGLASVVIAVVQYFVPALTDYWLIAGSGTVGRAVGNMRQPNHLSTALLCSMVWTAWLWRAGKLSAPWAAASIVAMVLGVAMTASRTGAVSLAVLLLWAMGDRSLPRGARIALAATPLAYLAFWALLAGWAEVAGSHFYAADRLQSSSDVSSSRFAIWRNAVSLVARHPWGGVGWGNFNFAWTFSPFPDRPVAFFDHTHNLPLQLAVEAGVPLTLAVIALLIGAVWRARSSWLETSHEPLHAARAALVMLAVLAVHSLLEYPLWYAYFLLPASWALGLLIGSARDGANGQARAAQSGATALQLGGALMLAGAVYAVWDHHRIEVIFAPPPDAEALSVRIEQGQRSLLFGHHADYAAVTTPPRDQRLSAFRRPLHQLVDIRLLTATIEALRARGLEAEALYAAQRLREFRRPDAQAWFKNCDAPEPPWQCDTRPVPLTWRDIDRVMR